jgi:hypothetical protein
MRLRPLLAGLAVASFLVAGNGSAAAAITVSNTNDSGPGSLRQAVAEAPPGETIVVPAGTYTLTSGELQILKGLTLEGHSPADTTLTAVPGSRVVVAAGKFDLTVTGLAIRDAVYATSGAIGAGMLAATSSLTLRDVLITHNAAIADGASGENGGSVQGGGLVVTGALTMTDSRVTDNTASAVGGSGAQGGSALGGGIVTVGAVSISNTTISGNRADARGGQGPASASQDGGSAQGGGVLIIGPEGGQVSISNSTISGNVVDTSGGPGGTAGTAYGGGGLTVSSSATTIGATTIASNVVRDFPAGGTAYGGALLSVTGEAGSMRIIGSTISGNRVEAPSPTNSLAGNLFATGPTSIGGTIVTDGVGPAGSENCFLTEGTSLGFNLDSLDQCNFHAASDQIGKAPMLGPLQDNGGPTATMLPDAASPVVDQSAAFGLGTDQRGVQRPIDLPSIPNPGVPGADGSDIGATELQPSNAFTLGKLRKNRKKGTATLTVLLPQPSAGQLILSGKGLRTRRATVAGVASLKLKVAGKRKVRKALRKKGKRKVKIKVTYTPTGNAPATLSRTTKLVKKRKKRHRGHRKR